MILIVIDTCILKKLVNALETDRNLTILHDWAGQKQVQVLAPAPILTEWNDKHKEETLRNAQKAINEVKKIHKQKKAIGLDDGEPDIDPSHKRIMLQAEMIDTLLASSPKIPNYGPVLEMIEDLKVSKTPPFFNQNSAKDNSNDAKIIFISLEWAKQAGATELFFVSENKDQFESRDVPGTIHPGIQSKYADVAIRYFKKANDAIHFLKERGLPVKPHYKPRQKTVNNNIIVSRDKHLLDQLFDFMEARLKEWNFLPRQFFIQQYPFIVTDNIPPYSFPFTISTNHQALFDFLQGIDVDENNQYRSALSIEGVENAQEKLERVFRGFHFNYLSKIFTEWKDQHNLAQKEDRYCCLCYLCAWRRLDLTWLSRIMEHEPTELWDIMQWGYIHYKFCRYEKAIEIFIQAYPHE